MSSLPECPWCRTPFVPYTHASKCPKCGGERPAYVGWLEDRWVKPGDADLKTVICSPSYIPIQDPPLLP